MSSPNTVRAAQILFYTNAAIWLIFGGYTLVAMAYRAANQGITMWIVGILMFGNAGAMLLAGFGIGRPRRLFFLFAIVVLAINIFLTFTDQFGIFDFLTLLVDIVALTLLVLSRSWYDNSK